MYALNLKTDGRILSATREEFATPDMPLVDELPQGDISDYIYSNGNYIYSPIQKPYIDKQIQIQSLKAELATYDYIGVKIAMGVATAEDYAEEIAYTETLRSRIRELEA